MNLVGLLLSIFLKCFNDVTIAYLIFSLIKIALTTCVGNVVFLR